MRCLVTGSRGLLGTELVGFLRGQGEEVVAWDLPGHDVTDVEKTINGMHKVGPQVVYHLAAWTDVDACESDLGKASAVNFQGAWAVALGAAELRCKLVYLSTDYVFDGRAGRPYRENDKPNPLSVYGKTKLMGEQAVAKACRSRFIVRTSGLYGHAGRNFVDTIAVNAAQQPKIDVVSDQVASPTWAKDICRPLWELGKSDAYGTYHLTNSGRCSWFELAQEVVRIKGASCDVVPIDSAHLGRPAPRPSFSALENRQFKLKFGKLLRPWQEALKAYLG
jgi:dTDP-4-dehydrorhamnose reductase